MVTETFTSETLKLIIEIGILAVATVMLMIKLSCTGANRIYDK